MKKVCLILSVVGLSLFLCAQASADTTASNAVQISAKNSDAPESAAKKSNVQDRVGQPEFEYSSGSIWSDVWVDMDTVYYRVEMRDSNDRIIASDGVYPSTTYPDEWYDKKGLWYGYYWMTELETGFYTYKRTGYDKNGNNTGSYSYQFYFRDNASLCVTQSERKASAAYSVRGAYEILFEPEVDWTQKKVLTKRYRIQIVEIKDASKIDEKDAKSPILVDTYTTKAKYEIDKADLPVGQYTIRVWHYPSVSKDPYILHLTVRKAGREYDYNLPYDLNITPGESITRQHAVGSKDMTLYTAVKLETDSSPMTKLRLGGQTLEAECGGRMITANAAGDTLTLSSDGSAWRITQKALHTLKESGVSAVRFLLPDGGEARLPTDLEFSGRLYGNLRASGLVSKDFALVWQGDGWAVEAEGKTYDYDPQSGSLTEREAA